MTQKLLAGTQAPDFALLDSTGQKVSLSDFRGRNVIVYFYPEASTPGCTTEACDFRDSLASLQGSGYEVLGISPDAPEKIARFVDEFSLTFPLLSDENHAVALAYGAWGEKLVVSVHQGVPPVPGGTPSCLPGLFCPSQLPAEPWKDGAEWAGTGGRHGQYAEGE